MNSKELVSLQESLLGYFYNAIENLESLIQSGEKIIDTLNKKSRNEYESKDNSLQAILTLNWERNIDQLRATLKRLKKIIIQEERRLHKLTEYSERMEEVP
ncbi:MAG: hypothetical protein QXX95_00570 [Nitrososphaerales archaeon]